jgi:hypothetical protein
MPADRMRGNEASASMRSVSSLADIPSLLLRTLLSALPVPLDLGRTARSVAETKQVDRQKIAAVFDASGVGPLVFTRMKEVGVADLFAPTTARMWEVECLHSELQCELQRRDVIRITRRFAERGIRHAIIKGFVVREWLYEPTWVRASCDTDILVDPWNVEEARSEMYNLGFVQAARTEDFRNFRAATPQEIQQTESQHYELAQFAKLLRLKNAPQWLLSPDFRRQAPSAFELRQDHGPVLNSVVDVHWALHFVFAEDRPLDSLITVTARDGTFEIPTLSVEWHILFTAFKLYFESFDRPGWGLHLLADLAALLQAGGEALDWDWIKQQAGLKDLEAMLFYTLCAAERLLGTPALPPDLLESLSISQAGSAKDREAHRDFGDFLPYVLLRRLPSSFLDPVH